MLSILPSAIVDGILIGLTYGLVAAGLGLIWGVMDIVNFAHGEHMLIAMYVTLLTAAELNVDPLLLLPVNVVLMFLIGYATYFLVIKRVMDGPVLGQVLCTFGLLLVIRYGIMYAAGPTTRTIDDFVFAGSTTVFGISISFPEVLTALVSIVTVAALYVLLQKTETGKAIRATAQDKQAAQVLGIETDRVYAVAWGIGLAATGVAGTMVATFFPVQPEATPVVWTIASFAAVALGGLGGILGPVAGGVVIGLVENIGAAVLDSSYRQLYVYLVLIGALIYQREGILNWVNS
ncbi:branched-chain amino acid ABC transporter permease [Natrinema versiforme]|uniref:Branched-chain amino acid ABC transporter permease n=1 Tax=Natrinema versiforme TaxID=88724 RepID=A0A4P8WMM6_9EURY|nr:branched-chain amino acid ABC transporter permease [Natrinema versiforme]QCS44848.1 branched-chain amino acid ABC transporter permease [Natrinema versiforme]